MNIDTDTAGLVRNDHPATSRAAAMAAIPRTGTDRRRVYDAIVDAGHYGATDRDLVDRLQLCGDTERPRRIELVRGGHVKDAGFRRHEYGRDRIVWVATRLEDEDDDAATHADFVADHHRGER